MGGEPGADGVEVAAQQRIGDIAALAQRDKAGYLLTDDRMGTATPGFFAAGDCRQKTVRQLTTAVSDGTLAAVAACEWLAEQEANRINQTGRAHAAR